MIEIRPARDDDDAALLALDAETWSVDATPAPPREGVPSFFGSRLDPTDAVVAELDGVVVGYATLHNAIPVPAHADVLEINGVAVHPGATGQGVGQALVEAAVTEAIRRGARKVSLRVLGPNTVARRLYARCGFAEEGVLHAEFLLGGRLVDDVIMSRFVEPAEMTPLGGYAADNAATSRQSTIGSEQSGHGTS